MRPLTFLKPLMFAASAALSFLIPQNACAQAIENEVVVPNANLRATGIPPIPARVARALHPYGDFSPTTLVSWHPSDGSMTVLRRSGAHAQLFRLTAANGQVEQMTAFSEPVRSARWEPVRARYMLISRDVGGSEADQIFRYHPDTKESVQLTSNDARHSLGPWSPKRDRIIIVSSPLNKTGVSQAEVTLRAVDPFAPEKATTLLKLEGAGWYPVVWLEQANKLWVSKYISATERELYEIDIATGQRRALPAMEIGSWGDDDEDVASDARELFVRAYDKKQGEYLKLFRYHLASGAMTPVPDTSDGDVESWTVSPDGKTLAFAVNVKGVSVLSLVDTKTMQAIEPPALPAAQISRLRWHPKSHSLAMNVNDPNSPNDVFEANIAARTLTRWTESRPKEFLGRLNAKAELVTWRAFDGREISAIQYRPAARFTGPRPVIVNIHGGPESQSRPSFIGRWHYYLNELGATVILPNVRGSSGFGKTFLTLDNARLREESVKDIGAMLDWIKTQPHLDAGKIAITGGSYGGYMSLAVSTFYPERISCAVDSVGISNFVTFLERTETYRRDLRRSEYGDERDPEMRKFLNDISPLTNAHKIKKPLFVVHGINDPRVPFNEAEQIVEKVRANGTPVWTLYADNEGHGFARRPNADFLFYAQSMFFEQCFK